MPGFIQAGFQLASFQAKRIATSRLLLPCVSDFYFDVVIRRIKQPRVDLIASPARNRRSRSITTSVCESSASRISSLLYRVAYDTLGLWKLAGRQRRVCTAP